MGLFTWAKPKGNLFESNSTMQCCLCGSPDDLTGEHKIKASAIRELFSGPMVIGAFDGESRPRFAQSAKSKAFHFRARLCGTCNSSRTSAADLEFTEFDKLARERMEAGLDPGDVFKEPRYTVGGEPYLNLFRYFAKVLACQIAQEDGPRILPVTEFAIGKSDFNPVLLAMDLDPAFLAFSQVLGSQEFAAHGGLAMQLSRLTGLVHCLFSTLTHGKLRYTFSIEFDFRVGLALQRFDPVFHERCVAAHREAVAAKDSG
ncbi:hypothetical protein [Lysobacter enzymogenes]|nr:hypothetical protein [Lysobacter enzymogenes]